MKTSEGSRICNLLREKILDKIQGLTFFQSFSTPDQLIQTSTCVMVARILVCCFFLTWLDSVTVVYDLCLSLTLEYSTCLMAANIAGC